MNALQIPNQIIQFNKMAIDKSIENMMLMEDRYQRFMKSLLEKSSWFNDEGKKAITDLMSSYRKGFEGLKSISDESFNIISKVLSGKEDELSKFQKISMEKKI